MKINRITTDTAFPVALENTFGKKKRRAAREKSLAVSFLPHNKKLFQIKRLINNRYLF